MKIAITGDWHLRDRQFGSAIRGTDFHDAALRAVSGIVRKADIAIVTGDNLDNNTPSTGCCQQLALLLKTLASSLPTICISGNHDWREPTWPQVLIDRNMDNLFLPYKETEKISIKGLRVGYIRTHRNSDEFMEELEKLGDIDILVYHGPLLELQGYTGETQVTPPTVERISKHLSQYNHEVLVALGDIHKAIWHTSNGIHFCYPGSTEMTAASHDIQKGWYLVEATKGENGYTFSAEFQKIDTRDCEKITLSTHEDVEVFKIRLCKHTKDTLFFIWYSKEVEGDKESIIEAAPKNCFIRWISIAVEQVKAKAREASLTTTPAEVLREMIRRADDDDELVELGLSILELPTVDTAQLIHNFIIKK